MTGEQLDLLRRALQEAGTREVKYYESLSQTTYTPSARFEKHIQKLIRTQKTPIYPLIKSPTRKAVTVLVAVMLLFSLSLSVSAIREPVFSAFERITEKFTEIIFPRSAQDGVFTEYQAEWIPEQYELHLKKSTDRSHITEWRYLNFYICLDQMRSGNFHLDTENAEIQKTTWGGKEVTYFQKYNNYQFKL